MKIVHLHVSNIKRIKLIDIEANKNTMLITGQNNQGKSSTLDSIAMALGGKNLCCENPVRNGEKRAEIIVDIGDYTVRRHWTNPETSYLEVKNKEGAKLANAQAFLDGIIGKLSFDPLAFTTLEPKKRLEILKNISGVDFDEMDNEHKELYEKRKNLNIKIDVVEKTIQSYADIKPVEPVENIEEINKQRAAAIEHNNKTNERQRDLANYRSVVSRSEEMIRELEKEIAKEKDKINTASLTIADIETALEKNGALADTKQFDEKINRAMEYKLYQNKMDALDMAKKRRENEAAERDKVQARMDEIVETKKFILSTAKMPVNGLSLGAKDVEFDSVPFENLCTSEQIKVSFAISVATNPKLRIAMIKHGSLLDDKSLEMVKEMADKYDTQIWIEKIESGPKSGAVFISNGEVVE